MPVDYVAAEFDFVFDCVEELWEEEEMVSRLINLFGLLQHLKI